MRNYDRKIKLHSYGSEMISIDIPKNVNLYLLEIDFNESLWEEYIELVVMGGNEILYAGGACDDLLQILLNKRVQEIDELQILIKPVRELLINTNKWYIFNDAIFINLYGVEVIGEIKYSPAWEDMDNFSNKWT